MDIGKTLGEGVPPGLCPAQLQDPTGAGGPGTGDGPYSWGQGVGEAEGAWVVLGKEEGSGEGTSWQGSRAGRPHRKAARLHHGA